MISKEQGAKGTIYRVDLNVCIRVCSAQIFIALVANATANRMILWFEKQRQSKKNLLTSSKKKAYTFRVAFCREIKASLTIQKGFIRPTSNGRLMPICQNKPFFEINSRTSRMLLYRQCILQDNLSFRVHHHSSSSVMNSTTSCTRTLPAVSTLAYHPRKPGA